MKITINEYHDLMAKLDELERENARLRDATIQAEVVGFDCGDKTITLQFSEMPVGKIGEKWFILSNISMTESR
jgi:hypothetical protein